MKESHACRRKRMKFSINAHFKWESDLLHLSSFVSYSFIFIINFYCGLPGTIRTNFMSKFRIIYNNFYKKHFISNLCPSPPKKETLCASHKLLRNIIKTLSSAKRGQNQELLSQHGYVPVVVISLGNMCHICSVIAMVVGTIPNSGSIRRICHGWRA